jgi:hypothetical protein
MTNVHLSIGKLEGTYKWQRTFLYWMVSLNQKRTICQMYIRNINFRHTFWLSTITFLLILPLVTACGEQAATHTSASSKPVYPTPAPTPTPVVSSLVGKEWHLNWTKGIPCAIPCWNGVTPGKTTITEALSILNNSAITSDAKANDILVGRENIVYISFRPEALTQSSINISPAEYPYAYYNTQTAPNLINTIILKLGTYKFKDIKGVLGEPSHILATVDFNIVRRSDGWEFPVPYYETLYIYLDRGILFYGKSDNIPVIDDNTTLAEMRLFAPGLDGLKKSNPPRNYDLITVWEGLKDFEFYCRYPDQKVCKRSQ